MSRVNFQEQIFKVREEAILSAVRRLLAEKGFDTMTVDEVAAEVGIGKASLYKHFASKEDLAAAAMAHVLERALMHAQELASNAGLQDIDRLRDMARWALRSQLRGEMPALPIQNPQLRAAMVRYAPYMDRLVRLGDQMGGWIDAARVAGQLSPALPAEFTLYTLFAKGCDPVVFILKETGQYDDECIVEWAVDACFHGLGPVRTTVAVQY